jgi:hypothetical protein
MGSLMHLPSVVRGRDWTNGSDSDFRGSFFRFGCAFRDEEKWHVRRLVCCARETLDTTHNLVTPGHTCARQHERRHKPALGPAPHPSQGTRAPAPPKLFCISGCKMRSPFFPLTHIFASRSRKRRTRRGRRGASEARLEEPSPRAMAREGDRRPRRTTAAALDHRGKWCQAE